MVKKTTKVKITLDEKLSQSGYIGNKNKEIKRSPLIIKKSTSIATIETSARKDISNFFDNFAKKAKISKVKDENGIIAVTSDEEESEKTPILKDNKQKILKDIDCLESKPPIKPRIKNASSSTLTKKENTKQISDYFIKFEYKKLGENKFVND